MCGTVAGGFMWFIVRPIARRFMSWSDTTPASNVSGTHSYLAAVRRTDRIPLWHLPEKFMTLQKAKSIARHLGLTLREVCSGDVEACLLLVAERSVEALKRWTHGLHGGKHHLQPALHRRKPSGRDARQILGAPGLEYLDGFGACGP